MKRRQGLKKKARVQKVKKTRLSGNELFRSVRITVPKKLVNKVKRNYLHAWWVASIFFRQEASASMSV